MIYTLKVLSCHTVWTPVQHDVDINYDLEISPLQIKADGDDQMRVYFYTAQRSWTGGVQFSLNSPPRYYLNFCSTSWTDLPTALPTETDKIWTVTLSKTSGIKLTINCNNKEVLNVVMSNTTCSDSRWSTFWSRDMEMIQFGSSDTASDFYRPGN